MKNRMWGIAGALSMSFLFALPAHADADFRLANTTGYTIYSIYVTPYAGLGFENLPGADRLGNRVLHSGQSFRVDLADNASCRQDVLVTFSDTEETGDWQGVNLCGLNGITVGYGSDTGHMTATGQ
jgi:hypothetical protein